LRYTFEEYGEHGFERYAALITQAIADFAADPTGPAVRRVGAARHDRTLLRYDLVSSRANVPADLVRIARPRHFLIARLEGDILRILYLARDSMAPENVLRRSRHSDLRDD
jgi:hypothetical protein